MVRTVPVWVVLCWNTHSAAVQNVLVLIWVRLMYESSVSDIASDVSSNMNKNHSHLWAYLDWSYFTPSRGSAAWVLEMCRWIVSVLTCVRVPMEYSVPIRLTSSSWHIDALTFVHRDHVVWCFGLVFNFFAWCVVGVWIIDTVCARVNHEYDIRLCGWPFDNGLMYRFGHAGIIHTIICKYCIFARPYGCVSEVAFLLLKFWWWDMYFVTTQGDLSMYHGFWHSILVDVIVVILVYSVSDGVNPLVVKHASCLAVFRANVNYNVASVNFLCSYEFHEVIGRPNKTVRFCVVVFGPVWESRPKLIAALRQINKIGEIPFHHIGELEVHHGTCYHPVVARHGQMWPWVSGVLIVGMWYNWHAVVFPSVPKGLLLLFFRWLPSWTVSGGMGCCVDLVCVFFWLGLWHVCYCRLFVFLLDRYLEFL